MGNPVDKLNTWAHRTFRKPLREVVDFKEETTDGLGWFTLEVNQEFRDRISQRPGLSQFEFHRNFEIGEKAADTKRNKTEAKHGVAEDFLNALTVSELEVVDQESERKLKRMKYCETQYRSL